MLYFIYNSPHPGLQDPGLGALSLRAGLQLDPGQYRAPSRRSSSVTPTLSSGGPELPARRLVSPADRSGPGSAEDRSGTRTQG